MSTDRWEYGAELTLPERFEPIGASEPMPWDGGARWYGSGRDALRALLRHGRANRDWKRLLGPSYLCQEVVLAALDEMTVEAYVDRPSLNSPDDRELDPVPGDVVLVSNSFGLRDKSWQLAVPGVEVIEDHSHDPWSAWAFGSSANYAVAGLRHTLPLPDGGVAWSPRGDRLPPAAPTTPERSRASSDKLAAMLLKGLYLSKHAVDKDRFRRIAADAERQIASGEISGMTRVARALLDVLPIMRWREQRKRNFDHASRVIVDSSDLRLLRPSTPSVVPYALAFVFDSASERSHARARLLAARVYPEVLWPLEMPHISGIDAAARDLSQRMLALPCDYRYETGDLDRALDCLQKAVATNPHRVETP